MGLACLVDENLSNPGVAAVHRFPCGSDRGERGLRGRRKSERSYRSSLINIKIHEEQEEKRVDCVDGMLQSATRMEEGQDAGRPNFKP